VTLLFRFGGDVSANFYMPFMVAVSYRLLFPWWPVWRRAYGRALARDPKVPGFESRPVRFQLTALDKLLTRMYLCHRAV